MMYMFLCIQKGNNYYFSFILKVPEVIGCQQLSISLLGHRATKHCMRSLKNAWGRRMSKIMCLHKKEEGSLDCCWLRALSIQEKKPEVSVVAKVEFPIGEKLFHLVVNPGTSRCPTVDLELVQTTRNVNGTRHSVRKFQPGKRAHLFRFSTFSGNFPVGRAYETCSIYRRTGNYENFD